MFVYMVMATASFVFLIWKIKLADLVASASAPIGASFTFIALVTGSIWGKPMWGTWWVWDARLTSELLLLFLYLGYIALRGAIDTPSQAARATAILALVGVINIPVIHYSIEWWNTLHQPASIAKIGKPLIHISMLIPLLLMVAAFQLLYAWNLMAKCIPGFLPVRKELAGWLNYWSPDVPDLQTFFNMGGYAAYIWSAYGITFVVLFVNIISTRIAHKRQCQELRRELARKDRKLKTGESA